MKAFFRFCLVFFGRGARGSVQLDDAVTHCLGIGELLFLGQDRNISEVARIEYLAAPCSWRRGLCLLLACDCKSALEIAFRFCCVRPWPH
jgi:hypothetical protein